MRLLFVALRWDYKDPARGPSFEFTNLWDSLRRMEDIDAELFPVDEVEQRLGRVGMNEALMKKADALDPDLIFFVLFEDEISPLTVQALSHRWKTLNWFTDDHWRFEVFSREWAPWFTWVATTDAQALDRYRDIGCDHALLTQWGCNHHAYRPLDVPRDLPISFVGQPHGSRETIVERMRFEGLDVRTWGYGWPEGRVDQEQMIEVFNRSKINLNLSNASLQDRPTIVRWIVREARRRPWKPSRVIRALRSIPAIGRQQLKGRNFEIPGCKALLLTERVPRLEEYYEPDVEVATYSNANELIEKCRYLLDNESVREEIAEAGFRRTIADHTYERRLEDLFRATGLL